MYTKQDLKAKGFSDSLIKKLLPAPVMRSAGRVVCHLWEDDDVDSAMQTEAFVRYQAERKRRQLAARRTAERKTEALLAKVRSETKITVIKHDYWLLSLVEWVRVHQQRGLNVSQVLVAMAEQITKEVIVVGCPDFKNQTGAKDANNLIWEMIRDECKRTYPEIKHAFDHVKLENIW